MSVIIAHGAAAVFFFMMWSIAATAQESPGMSPAATPQVQPHSDTDPSRKPVPPPLFPRHGRGLYRNGQGENVIDATPQSPPLDSDDPAVPDDGQYEINVSTHADYAKAGQRVDILTVDVNYGVRPGIHGHHLPTQIKLEFPVAAARQAGEPFNTGLGAAKLGLKFNFYDDEHRGLSISVYPQVGFAAAGSRAVRKGLADNGQTIFLPLLAAREFHEFTLVFNGALNKPMHDHERQTSADLGVAFGRALTRKNAAMIELRTESGLDFRRDRLVYGNAGYIHGVRNIIMYANVGHSMCAGDGLSHAYAGIGIKLQIDTRRPAPRSVLPL